MENSVNILISKIAIVSRIANEKLMCDIGLHSGQAQILRELGENDGSSQAELVRSLCVSAPTVNKMVSRLAEAGFVTTRQCPEDNRLVRVRLTAKGARIQPEIKKQLRKLETALLAEFSETENVLLPFLLEKIHSNLQKIAS